MYTQDYISLLAPKDQTPGVIAIYERVREYVKKSGVTVHFNGMVVTTSVDFEKYWLERIEREYGEGMATTMRELAKKIKESEFDDTFGILNDIIGTELSLPTKFRFNQIKARLAGGLPQYRTTPLWFLH